LPLNFLVQLDLNYLHPKEALDKVVFVLGIEILYEDQYYLMEHRNKLDLFEGFN
jgi:hypothetical protein